MGALRLNRPFNVMTFCITLLSLTFNYLEIGIDIGNTIGIDCITALSTKLEPLILESAQPIDDIRQPIIQSVDFIFLHVSIGKSVKRMHNIRYHRRGSSAAHDRICWTAARHMSDDGRRRRRIGGAHRGVQNLQRRFEQAMFVGQFP
jgi:hypothetical protein